MWFILGMALGMGAGRWGVQRILAAGSARVFLTPVTTNVPPNGNLTVKVDSGATTVGFVQVQLNFDPAIINLTGEITATGSMTTVVQKTSMANANASGSVTIALALPPENVGSAPSGEFSIADIPFGAATTSANLLTSVTVNTEGVQVVGMDTEAMSVTGENATVNVNYIEPTPTVVAPTPIPTAEPSPTPTAVPTPIPTATPTPIPTEVPPTPTVIPTPTPVVRGGASLSLVPVSQGLTGHEWGVKVNLSTTELLSGVDVVVSYDPRKISGVRFEDGSLLSSNTQVNINNGNGVIRLSQTMPVGQGFIGDGTMGTLIFNPLAAGNIVLSIVFTPGAKNESNAVALSDGADILNSPSELSATIWDEVFVKVHLSTPSESTVVGQMVSGTVQTADALWSNNFDTDLAGNSGELTGDPAWTGTLKQFLVKVSGFLRRRVSITPVGGVNIVDAGLLVAGDMNNDGIINNVDLSLMYDQWFSLGSADYNRDGVVNSADHWILTHNFLLSDE